MVVQGPCYTLYNNAIQSNIQVSSVCLFVSKCVPLDFQVHAKVFTQINSVTHGCYPTVNVVVLLNIYLHACKG